MLKDAFPTALLWSMVIILPCFLVIFRVSQVLFPGRVGILTMPEVVVAIISASLLLPNETNDRIKISKDFHASHRLLLKWLTDAALTKI